MYAYAHAFGADGVSISGDGYFGERPSRSHDPTVENPLSY